MDLSPLEAYEGVIFDLDGTLVNLATDWKAAHQVVDAILGPALGIPFGNLSIWAKVELARREGLPGVEETLAALEIEGARRAVVLPLAQNLGRLDRPRGICTMNCHRSVELSLRGLPWWRDVRAVVAREESRALKPDPQPLHDCLKLLGLRRQRVVYVGDMRRDEDTAQRLGMDFLPAQGFNGGKYPFEPKS